MSATITDKSGKSFLEFLDRAAEKGWLNKNTAAGYRAACQRVLEVEKDWEELDVSQVEVDSIIQRFVNLKGGDYSPGSLETYKSRFRTALETYLDWANDPSVWRPPTTLRRKRGERQSQPQQSTETGNSVAPRHRPSPPPPRDGMITYPFPLRDDTDVQLILPRDLKPDEAKRLIAFVNALAVDELQDEGGQRSR